MDGDRLEEEQWRCRKGGRQLAGGWRQGRRSSSDVERGNGGRETAKRMIAKRFGTLALKNFTRAISSLPSRVVSNHGSLVNEFELLVELELDSFI